MATQILDFGRESESVARIYMQHWIIREQFGFLLPPKIPRDRPNVKIVDLACGCGIWLIELATQLRADAQLDGFDISPAHFPAQEELPSNVRLEALDCLAPVPEHLRGVYDIVHARGFMLHVPNGDPTGLLENQLALLKPGGLLFWEELDVINMYVKPPGGQYPSCEKYIHYGKRWMKERGIEPGWTSEMPSILNKGNIEVIESSKMAFKDSLAKPWTVMQALATKDFIQNDIIPTCGIDAEGLGPDQWRKVLEKFPEECQAGARVLMDISWVIGKKPV